MLATVFFNNSYAQDRVSGTVTDESGKPVVGATVQIKGTFSAAATDAEGRFSLETKGESSVLVISHLSFETNEMQTAAGESDIKIILKQKLFLADEVIVSATRGGNVTSSSSAEVSREEISKQNLAQDIPYLLDQTPSIVTASDAGAGVGYTYLRIRGSNQSRINVTLNGIPFNEAESQEVYWVDLPDIASSVDNLVIQRGVGTSTNGASAFGGSVNIQTDKLREEPYGELSGSYGSFNTWKASAKFGTGLIKNKFTFDGRLSQIKSDGYIERASSDLKSFFASAGYYNGKTILRFNIFSGLEDTYQAWWGVAESYLENDRTHNHYDYPNEVDHYLQTHYQLLFSQQASEHWTFNAALHYTRGKGYYEQYKGPEYNNDDGFNSKQVFADYGLPPLVLDDTTIMETSLARRRWLDNHFYGATFSALYRKNKINMTLGGAANRYNGNHFGEIIWAEYSATIPKDYRYYDSDGTKGDANIYAKANYQATKKLNAFLDLQYRFMSHEMAGVNDDRRYIDIVRHHHFFNPKAGFTYDLNPFNKLFFSFGIGNREPARSDYTDAPPARLPNPERLRDLEVGYSLSKPKNRLRLNYYFMQYNNQLVLTGELNDVGSAIKTNVDKSYRTGIEMMNSLKPVEKFRWDVNIACSINKIKDFTEVIYVHDADDYSVVDTVFNQFSNTDIAYSPYLVAGSTVSYQPVKNLGLDFIAKYVSKQYLDNTGSDFRSIDGYFLGNFRISYSLKEKFFDEIRFTLLLNNLFNTLYESNGYVYSEMYQDAGGIRSRADYNYYSPQARFNVMGGVTVKF